jgi:hypothetical protein
MSTGIAPYRSSLEVGREGFAQLLHGEWTKFRTVRGWVIAALASALLIVLFAYLGTFRHEDSGICVRPNSATGTCASFAHPGLPIGPGGEAVTDTYTFVHRTLTGSGSITVRVSSLTGHIQGGSGGSASVADMSGAAGPVQAWAKAGLIISASARPGAAYAAVMLTGGHGIRLQYDYTGDIAGPAAVGAAPRWLRLARSGATVTADESADGSTWRRVGSVRLAGLPASVAAGVFVTSPQTAPTAATFVPGSIGVATGLTASFTTPALRGGWMPGGWTGGEVGNTGVPPTLSSVGARRTGSGFTLTGSGDIAPSISDGETDRDALTGVFVGLIVLVVLGAMFITVEYRRRLIHTTLAASPRRARMFVAKAIVIATVAFIIGAAASAVSISLGDHILRANGNFVYPVGTLTLVRVILGTGALVALAAVLALALGTALRRSAAAVTAAIVLIVLPYVLVFAAAVPAGVSQWLMRVTPAAAFAIEQTLPSYHQVSYLYTPSEGFYPLAPGLGLAVLGVYALIAAGVAMHLLRTRDA